MRPCDALVTGFVRSPLLLERSLAPLRRLRQEGVLRAIHYVTWDDPELDACVAPLAAMADVALTRVAAPRTKGNATQRGIVYQVQNLRAALEQIRGDDGLILKSRPDFVVAADVLRAKIAGFDRDCAVPERLSRLGVTMPPPVLQHKIWIPWADSNQPFFYEDALFLGAAGDIRKLATTLTAADRDILADPQCGPYAHVVRYARLFTETWPIFRAYLRHYGHFLNDTAYRVGLMPRMLQDGFFWHLLIAHAWILHSQFHVDAGAQGALQFYPNTVNRNADWSRPETLNLGNPYDKVAVWRAGTGPGAASPSLQRPYGRLMDDAWHRALFTAPLSDFPDSTLKPVMENVAGHGDGRLGGIEAEFYAMIAAFHRDYRPPAPEFSSAPRAPLQVAAAASLPVV